MCGMNGFLLMIRIDRDTKREGKLLNYSNIYHIRILNQITTPEGYP